MKTLPRMLLIANRNLSKGQAAAQTGHALAQFALDHPNEFKVWNNGHIVILRGETEKLGLTALANHGYWTQEMQRDDVMLPISSCYREPDMGDAITAWAFLVANEEELKFCDLLFGDLPLL